MPHSKNIEFSLEGHDYIELNKLLKITGICNSGGEANTLITNGNIEVDGQIELRKRRKLRIDQKILFGSTHIIIQQ